MSLYRQCDGSDIRSIGFKTKLDDMLTNDLDDFDAQIKWREQIEDLLNGYVRIINNPTLCLYYEDMLFDEKISSRNWTISFEPDQ